MVKINDRGFILCPKCGGRTNVMVLYETVLIKFPLYCNHCKHTNIIDYKRA
jgi:hypothetical protein